MTPAAPAGCDPIAATDLAKVDGNFVLVGVPGCGKSGVVYDLARRLAEEDVVTLGVETLTECAGATRIDLGLHHDLADVLVHWSGEGRATPILDGLDAAHGEATTWLSSLASSLNETRWRVIASIRHRMTHRRTRF